MIFSIMQIKNRGDSSVSIPRANHPCRSKSLESHFKFKTFTKHLQDIPRANHLFQSKSHFHIFALEPENRVSIIASLLSFSYWARKSPALMAIPRNSEFRNSVMENQGSGTSHIFVDVQLCSQHLNKHKHLDQDFHLKNTILLFLEFPKNVVNAQSTQSRSSHGE